MWDDYCGQCIVFLVIKHNDDGTTTRIGNFRSEWRAEEYIKTHKGRYEIIEWDCS